MQGGRLLRGTEPWSRLPKVHRAAVVLQRSSQKNRAEHVLPHREPTRFVCSLFFRYFFRSGNIEHPGDKLFNTSVEVLPFDVSLSAVSR